MLWHFMQEYDNGIITQLALLQFTNRVIEHNLMDINHSFIDSHVVWKRIVDLAYAIEPTGNLLFATAPFYY